MAGFFWGSRGRRFKSSRPDQIKTRGYGQYRNPLFFAFLALGTHLGTHFDAFSASVLHNRHNISNKPITCLITLRSLVQIQPPLPIKTRAYEIFCKPFSFVKVCLYKDFARIGLNNIKLSMN